MQIVRGNMEKKTTVSFYHFFFFLPGEGGGRGDGVVVRMVVKGPKNGFIVTLFNGIMPLSNLF